MLGGGLLATAIAQTLARGAAVQPLDGPEAAVGGPCSVLIVASDGWDTTGYSQVRRASLELAVPWLPVRAELGAVIVGPVERPGVAGCVDCAELRRRRARTDQDDLDAVFRQHGPQLARRPSSWLTGLAAETVAALVDAEVAGLTRGPISQPADAARAQQAVLRVDLKDLTVTRHRFLPEPRCPHCGDLPGDAADLAAVTLAPRPKAAPGSDRVRPIVQELEQLTETYVDAETGLVPKLYRWTQGGLVVATATTRRQADDQSVPGSGRSRSYRTSEVTALLETLERYGGLQPGGKRTAVRAAYAEIAERALDPRTLGVHPPDSYRLDGFGYRPFTEEEVCDWVWGHSFARDAPILVPETCVYYGLHHASPRHGTPEGRGFVYEVSNGCALGGCLEEAILYGVLEVAERDAFLMTWYARLPAPRIDLSGARDRTVPLQAAAISGETGYEVTAFDITMEHGLPCVWVMAVNPDDPDPGPKLTCAAGSHLTVERALLNALGEVGPMLADLMDRFPTRIPQARAMAADASQVTEMEDHTILYGVPEVADRLRFLTDGTASRDLGDVPAAGLDGAAHADLRDDLRGVLARFLDRGMDVIVVDQTTPEHRAGGLACVKVLIPGMLPMTFGHHNRRVDGLPRLYEVPRLLGYRDRPLRPEEVNPYPHPFP